MLWTRWSGASSGILLTMSSQACVEKNEGSAGEWVAICLWFCKVLFRYYLSVTLQLICMPLFLCCVTNSSPGTWTPWDMASTCRGRMLGFLRGVWCHDPQGAIPTRTLPAHSLG
jgi:hypothetical protein